MGEAALEEPSEQQTGEVALRARLRRPRGDAELGPGVGEVELREGGRRVARGSFVTAANAHEVMRQEVPAQDGVRIVSATTARGVDVDGKAEGAAQSFKGDEKVWLVFEYEGAPEGQVLAVRWYCQDHELPAARTEVSTKGASGFGHAWLTAAAGRTLPPASYRVEVLSAGDGQATIAAKEFAVTSPGAPQAPKS